MARPTQFPRQLVMQVTDELAERVDQDAALRGDGSKSAAARRLLAIGALLADYVDKAPSHRQRTDLERIIAQAEAVR